MTCEQIEPDLWRLSFAEAEAAFIIHVLARLGRNYREDLSKMPPALRAYWQGTISRGKTQDKEALKESEEMLAEARAELRSERLALVEKWVQEFELAESRDPWPVDLTSAERDEFVAMLNDRRLLLGLELGISENEMAIDPSLISAEERRQAIFEIDILGHFIVVTLGPQIYRP